MISSLTGMVCGAAAVVKSMIPHARVGLFLTLPRKIDLDCVLKAADSRRPGLSDDKNCFVKSRKEILFRKKKKLKLFYI